MVLGAVDKIDRENAKGAGPASFSVGDTVEVHVKIHEGDKERVQVFTGTVIAKDGKASTGTFTVRRISHGVGVERIFPVHSPHIAEVRKQSSGRVRRAKLYFLRNREGKKARLKGKTRK